MVAVWGRPSAWGALSGRLHRPRSGL